MKRSADAQRILVLLEEALAEAAVPQQEIERRLGARRGDLSRLLCGRIPLTVERLLAILDAAGVPRTGFLDRLARPAAGALGGIAIESWFQELRGLRCRLELIRGPVAGSRPGR